jgi:hypothetical protein
MESLGMLLAFPVTATASIVYAILAVRLFSRWSIVRWTLLVCSVAVVLAAFTEAALIWRAGGPISARGWIGPRFESLHNFVFLLTPPAVANLLIFIPRPPLRDWKVVALATWFICIGLVFWNYDMMEKFYGPDGIGGPFSSERP